MEKRLIAAIVLSVAVLVGFQLLFPPAPIPQPPEPAAEQRVDPGSPPSATPVPAFAPDPAPGPEPGRSDISAGLPLDRDQIEPTRANRQELEIRTAEYRAVVDNQGGLLRHFRLMDYLTAEDRPVDLVPQGAPPLAGAYLALALPDDPALAEEINSLVFDIDDTSHSDEPTGRTRRVRFHYRRTGLEVEKILTFLLDRPYLVRVGVRVLRAGREVPAQLVLGPGLTNHALRPPDAYQPPPHLVSFDGGSRQAVLGDELRQDAGGRVLVGPFRWAGLMTKYFAAVVIPDRPFTGLEAAGVVWRARDVARPEAEAAEVNLVTARFPIASDAPVTLFMGPKSYRVLSAVRDDLAESIDYGWFALLVKPLYHTLLFVQSFVPNWGWSLVLLTLGITIAVFPLRWVQMKSMREMSKIQPQVKAIQAKYKGQKGAEVRQKMNEEVMRLYKEAGVNPMGGCLPILIQFPFLIAFYRLIDLSVEFWNQPFVFWIQDLSAKDPYYVTPILMGVTMIIQMKQAPATPGTGPDAAMQRKLMLYLMPVLMTFLFMNFSSGLVLYFMFSNIFGSLLQKGVETIIPSMAPVRPGKGTPPRKTVR